MCNEHESRMFTHTHTHTHTLPLLTHIHTHTYTYTYIHTLSLPSSIEGKDLLLLVAFVVVWNHLTDFVIVSSYI